MKREELLQGKESQLSQGESTRQLLLDAAEELFAEKSFADTSVRDITARAGCNLASINYHFGGKENLYLSVFQRLLTALREQRISGISRISGEPNLDLETFLGAFATLFFEPLVDESRGRRTMMLFGREIVRPRLPKGMIFQELVDPVTTVLMKALQAQFPGLTEETAKFCIVSLVGQLVHVIHSRKLYENTDHANEPVLDLSKAVDHIVKFSAAGIRKCAGEEVR